MQGSLPLREPLNGVVEYCICLSSVSAMRIGRGCPSDQSIGWGGNTADSFRVLGYESSPNPRMERTFLDQT